MKGGQASGARGEDTCTQRPRDPRPSGRDTKTKIETETATETETEPEPETETGQMDSDMNSSLDRWTDRST